MRFGGWNFGKGKRCVFTPFLLFRCLRFSLRRFRLWLPRGPPPFPSLLPHQPLQPRVLEQLPPRLRIDPWVFRSLPPPFPLPPELPLRPWRRCAPCSLPLPLSSFPPRIDLRFRLISLVWLRFWRLFLLPKL